MALYDIKGNVVSSGGSASGVTPNDTTFAKSEVINLMDNAEFVGNKRWTDNRWYDKADMSAYEIPIGGAGTYYTNIMGRTNDYNASSLGCGMIILDADKNVLSGANLLPTNLLGYDSAGGGIYADTGEFKVTDENARYLQLWYTTTKMPENPNINTQGYDFIEASGEFLQFKGHDLTRMEEQLAAGVMKNMGTAVDAKILEQVGRPNNLYGRRVYVIGDSNMDNWCSANKELFEQRYGCTVNSFATYGACFEVSDGSGTATKSRYSAIGQWNLLLEKEPIDPETQMLPEDIAIFVMMGTNCYTKGTETNRDGKDVTTAIGAMEWFFTQLSYYCRGDIPIGIILPVCAGIGHDNIIWSAKRHGFPYIHIEEGARQIQDNINSSIKAESFIVTGNHIASHGWKHFRRIVHNWMAYQC